MTRERMCYSVSLSPGSTLRHLTPRGPSAQNQSSLDGGRRRKMDVRGDTKLPSYSVYSHLTLACKVGEDPSPARREAVAGMMAVSSSNVSIISCHDVP